MWKEADEAEFETLTQELIRGSDIPVEIKTEYLPNTGQKRHNFSQFVWFTDMVTCHKEQHASWKLFEHMYRFTDKVCCFNMENHRPITQLFHIQGIEK